MSLGTVTCVHDLLIYRGRILEDGTSIECLTSGIVYANAKEFYETTSKFCGRCPPCFLQLGFCTNVQSN